MKIEINWKKLIAASNGKAKGKASYNQEYQNRFLGLLEYLVPDNIGVNGKEYTTCYLRFEDALETFYSCFKSTEFPYKIQIKINLCMHYLMNNGGCAFML